MANKRFYEIIKESLQEALPEVFRKLLHIDFPKLEILPTELQRTVSRRIDLVFKVPMEEPFILHLEFQTKNYPKMHERMYMYSALLFRKYKLPVKQVVLYIGKPEINMIAEIKMPDFRFVYELIDLKTHSYQLFLHSKKPEEVIFAILGNFGNTQPEEVIKEILTKLHHLVSEKEDLEKFTYHLETFAVLRNLQKKVTQQITTLMPLTIDIRKLSSYQEGKKEGEKEGKMERTNEIVLLMHKNGKSVKEITENTGLTEIQVKTIIEESVKA